jgi:hypothetical protein
MYIVVKKNETAAPSSQLSNGFLKVYAWQTSPHLISYRTAWRYTHLHTSISGLWNTFKGIQNLLSYIKQVMPIRGKSVEGKLMVGNTY